MSEQSKAVVVVPTLRQIAQNQSISVLLRTKKMREILVNYLYSGKFNEKMVPVSFGFFVKRLLLEPMKEAIQSPSSFFARLAKVIPLITKLKLENQSPLSKKHLWKYVKHVVFDNGEIVTLATYQDILHKENLSAIEKYVLYCSANISCVCDQNLDISLEICLPFLQKFQIATICGAQTVLRSLWQDNTADRNELLRAGKDLILHLAAIPGMEECVKWLLERNVSIHCRNARKDTILHIAARNKNAALVLILLERNADVDVENADGEKPLFAACEGGCTVVLGKLWRGEHIRDSKNHNTLLHIAAANGNCDAVNFLMDHNAKVNAVNRKNATPLHLATAHSQADVIRLLLIHGANIEARDCNHQTPLLMATYRNNAEIVRMLLDNGASAAAENRHKARPLHIAANRGYAEVAELLLNANAESISAKDEVNRIPLHYAALKNHIAVMHVLLPRMYTKMAVVESSEINLNESDKTQGDQCMGIIEARDMDGQTTLHLAARKGHTEVVALLLARNANICAQDDKGRTALHEAAWNNRVETVKLLLEHPEPDRFINIVENEYNNTALDFAVRYGHTEVMDLLRQNGAKKLSLENDAPKPTVSDLAEVSVTSAGDAQLYPAVRHLDVVNCREKMPLHLAVKSHNRVLRAVLFSGKCNKVNAQDHLGRTPLHVCIEHGNLDNLRVLLRKHGLDLNVKDKEDKTALRLALEKNDTERFVLLLESGADVNLRYNQDQTILHLAILLRCQRFVEILLSCSSLEPNLQNSKGDTALHLAIKKKKRHALIPILLNQENTQIDIENSDQETPLLVAARRGYGDIAEDLLRRGAYGRAVRSCDGKSALHLFLEEGKTDEVYMLLGRDPGIADIRDAQGETALHLAVRKQALGVISAVLQNSETRVKVKNSNGDTPLHLAADLGNADIVQLLLSAIRDDFVNCKNSENETALHIAAKQGHRSIAEQLVRHSLIDVNASKEDYEFTPLSYAAISDHWDIAELLLAKGARVNCEIDVNGSTPLHWAVQTDNVEAVNLLLRAPSMRGSADGWKDAFAKDGCGCTPLDYAKNENIIEVLERFLAKRGQLSPVVL